MTTYECEEWRRVVGAPVDGLLSRAPVQRGQHLRCAQRLARVQDLSQRGGTTVAGRNWPGVCS